MLPSAERTQIGDKKSSASAHLCERRLPSHGTFWIAELKEVHWTFAELKNKMVRERKACALRNYHRMIAEFNPWIPLSFWEASPNREVWSSSKRHWFKKKFGESFEIILSVLRVNRWNKIIQAEIFKAVTRYVLDSICEFKIKYLNLHKQTHLQKPRSGD